MSIFTFQSNMNSGELDPRLAARLDTGIYYNGMKKARNVQLLPQGGAKKRPGTKYLGLANDGILKTFSFNTEVNYLLVFIDLKMQIYKDGVLLDNINGSGNDFLNTPWTLAQLREISYVQSADTAIVAHESHAPRTITRTSDTNWSIDTISFVGTPQYDFDDASSPTPTSDVQTLTFTDHNISDRYKLSIDGFLTDEIVYQRGSTDAVNSHAADMKDALEALPVINAGDVTVVYASSAGVYTVTIANGSAKDWGLIVATPVDTELATFEGTSTKVTTGVARAEDAWSATRGYPSTATFHNGRLWFGGSQSLPHFLWGSQTNDFFNFEAGKGRAAESITLALNTNQINAIVALVSNRRLQIFTTGGEFYIPQTVITPSDVSILPVSNMGSKRVQPIVLYGETAFVQENGSSLLTLLVENQYQSTATRNASVLAPHLLDDVTELVFQKNKPGEDANYAFIVNTDGTIAVWSYLPEEGINGYSLWDTGDDKFKSLAVVDGELYALVERTVNSVVYRYIEVFDSTLQMDCCTVNTTSSTTISLPQLVGETVSAVVDGYYDGDEVVKVTGSTIDISEGIGYAGLLFLPEIETMPINVGVGNGPALTKKKRIRRATVYFYESNGVLVNGKRIADKTMGLNVFESPSPITGLKRVPLRGYSIESTVTITQTEPMPFTILGIGLEVSL